MIPNDNDYKGLYVYEAKPIQTGHGRSMYIQKPNKDWRFEYGTVVRKIKGSNWKGRVVGFYTSSFTKEGYAVESDSERGSVQIYPVTALEEVTDRNPLYPDDRKYLKCMIFSKMTPNLFNLSASFFMKRRLAWQNLCTKKIQQTRTFIAIAILHGANLRMKIGVNGAR